VDKSALVLGGSGFIGGHLVRRLRNAGYWVRAVDIKKHPYGSMPDDFVQGDLTDFEVARSAVTLDGAEVFCEVYQLAADMGGAGYIFTGENDANVMQNSASINLNILRALVERNSKLGKNETKVFYSSSACIYPEDKQMDPENPGLKESDAYPANPDSEYGWEKLFSERLYLSYRRNYGLPVHIARFHNIFGPEGTWDGGKEKAPAAICRKVVLASNPGEIEIWGDGNQTRSFLYVDECLDAIERLMKSEFHSPINIGSEEMVTINQLADLAANFEGKSITKRHIPGPQGVRGRNSDNTLIRSVLQWNYQSPLEAGLRETYFWIKNEVSMRNNSQKI
jgi:GDP-D-mannose 3',5'-epimerase